MKLADNMREGLESELAGLEGRLAGLGAKGGTADMRESLERRIGEVNAALGAKPKAKRQTRPAANGAEKRPAE